jgi:hypothetical protein
MLQLAAAEDPEVVPFCAPVPIPVPYPNNGFSWGQKVDAYANGVGDKNFFLEP